MRIALRLAIPTTGTIPRDVIVTPFAQPCSTIGPSTKVAIVVATPRSDSCISLILMFASGAAARTGIERLSHPVISASLVARPLASSESSAPNPVEN